jgi:hypothetical protein
LLFDTSLWLSAARAALDWISMLLIIGGMVMTIVGSESSLQNWGLKRMIERYRAPEVVSSHSHTLAHFASHADLSRS